MGSNTHKNGPGMFVIHVVIAYVLSVLASIRGLMAAVLNAVSALLVT